MYKMFKNIVKEQMILLDRRVLGCIWIGASLRNVENYLLHNGLAT